MDFGDAGSSRVGDFGHIRIIQARPETDEGMEKLGTKLGCSSKTIMHRIKHYNDTLAVLRDCDKCARVKSLLSKASIA